MSQAEENLRYTQITEGPECQDGSLDFIEQVVGSGVSSLLMSVLWDQVNSN